VPMVSVTSWSQWRVCQRKIFGSWSSPAATASRAANEFARESGGGGPADACKPLAVPSRPSDRARGHGVRAQQTLARERVRPSQEWLLWPVLSVP